MAIAVAAIVWSTGGLFIKLLPFDPSTILVYRSTCAALLFAAIFRRTIFKINRWTILVAVFYAGLLITFVTATKWTTAANAIFLQYTASIYVLLLEPWIFRLKLRWIDVVAVGLCLAGMSLFFAGHIELGGMQGNWLAVLSGAMLAGMLIGQRLNKPECYEAGVFWGNILVILYGLPNWMDSVPPTPPQWAMLLFLGFIQIGLGYILFNYGLKRVLAVEGALLGMLEPVLNPVWVYFGYGEAPSRWALIGGLLILATLAGRLLWLERAKQPAPSPT